jgi:hypothetical protein
MHYSYTIRKFSNICACFFITALISAFDAIATNSQECPCLKKFKSDLIDSAGKYEGIVRDLIEEVESGRNKKESRKKIKKTTQKNEDYQQESHSARESWKHEKA